MIVDQQLLSCSPPAMLSMLEKTSNAPSLTANSVGGGGGGAGGGGGGGSCGDLDDLNRALYDLGAQDLLDVWEAMGSEDGSSISSGSSCLNNNIGSNNNSSSGSSGLSDGLGTLNHSSSNLVLKDHLLTDSILSDQEFPPTTEVKKSQQQQQQPVVKQEHSYSVANNGVARAVGSVAGSDGDSMPGSPVSLQSLQDDMETECYPCIPMQSASNQKNNNSSSFRAGSSKNRSRGNLKRTAAHLHQLDLGSGETITIKAEPVSRGSSLDDEEDSNVDVVGGGGVSRQLLAKPFAAGTPQLSAAAQLNQLLPQLTPVQVPPGNSLLLKSHVQQQQQQVQFVRPKHPQSLLKPSLLPQSPSPVTTRTILVTTANNSNGIVSSSSSSSSPCSSSLSATASVSPPTAAAASKLLFSRLSSGDGASPVVAPVATAIPVTAVAAAAAAAQLSTGTIVSGLPSAVRLSPPHPIQCTTKGGPITTSLISSQPADSNGILVLTDEEKKTLIAEGYPIPSRLPLTKAEEKSLKKIRRKIKNKISAQESRRKKKEFVDTLERQVEVASQELCECKRKCSDLERENAALMRQLRQLQALVGKAAVDEQVKEEEEEEEDSRVAVKAELLEAKVEIKVERDDDDDEEEEEEEDGDDDGEDVSMKDAVCDGIDLD